MTCLQEIPVRQRYGTAAQWADANPIMREGEAGIESDTGKHKWGDGATAWNNLDYPPVPWVTTGTWTPVVEGTTTPGAHTYATQIGNWIRQGDLVFVNCEVEVTTMDAAMAGDLEIAGLPVAANDSLSGVAWAEIGLGAGVSFPPNERQFIGRIIGTRIEIHRLDNDGSDNRWPASDTGDGLRLRFSATYIGT